VGRQTEAGPGAPQDPGLPRDLELEAGRSRVLLPLVRRQVRVVPDGTETAPVHARVLRGAHRHRCARSAYAIGVTEGEGQAVSPTQRPGRDGYVVAGGCAAMT
jgi:hypothetical protein